MRIGKWRDAYELKIGRLIRCDSYTSDHYFLCDKAWVKNNMRGVKRNMKNMKIDANGTEIRVMGDVVNEDAYIFAH